MQFQCQCEKPIFSLVAAPRQFLPHYTHSILARVAVKPQPALHYSKIAIFSIFKCLLFGGLVGAGWESSHKWYMKEISKFSIIRTHGAYQMISHLAHILFNCSYIFGRPAANIEWSEAKEAPHHQLLLYRVVNTPTDAEGSADHSAAAATHTAYTLYLWPFHMMMVLVFGEWLLLFRWLPRTAHVAAASIPIFHATITHTHVGRRARCVHPQIWAQVYKRAMSHP